MSLQTWMQEFYPVKPNKRMTKRQAIEHSLRKWEGLTEENLSKHGCYKDMAWICDSNELETSLRIDDESCALCKKYYDYEGEYKNNACERCPLYKSLDNNLCDGTDSPYSEWKESGNPLPMIEALRKLLE